MVISSGWVQEATRAESREVATVDPVYDAELVEEPRYYSPRLCRFASWWLRSPRVPAWLESRRQAVQAGKDVLVAALRAPDRFVGAVVRGLVAAARSWRRPERAAGLGSDMSPPVGLDRGRPRPPPESTKISLRQRLTQHAQARWPVLAAVSVR